MGLAPRPGDDAYDVTMVDEAGTVYLTVEGYRTVELPGPIAEDKLATLTAAMRSAE